MKTIEERAREIAERIERERYLHSQSNFDVDDATEIIASDLALAEEKGRREGIEKAKTLLRNEHDFTGTKAWNLICVIKTLDMAAALLSEGKKEQSDE